MRALDRAPNRALSRSPFVRAALATALVAGTLAVGASSPAAAATNPYQRGPAPTTASLNAAAGPFAVTTVDAANVSGFGAGKIYYPSDGSQKYGAVAIAPGFVSSWSSIAWLGPRLASQGFVVIGIDTSTPFDLPSVRGDEMLAALKNIQADSRVNGRIDSGRLAVAGWSMGGGGALDAGLKTPTLKAAVAIAPWEVVSDFSKLTVPAMVLTGDNDTIAPAAGYGDKFYASMPGSLTKSYAKFNNASHFFTNSVNNTEATLIVSWMKRFVDSDTRYDQFLCPGPTTPSTALDAYQATCPLK